MKRYMIERDIPGVGALNRDQLKGAAATSNQAISQLGPKVKWLESFVAKDKTFCIYLAEDEAAIREHARISGFPASTITEVPGRDQPRHGHRLIMAEAPLKVTVVLLDDGLSSTAIMPIEIFHSAGALWRELQGQAPQPRFVVTTASLDGGPVRSPYGLTISPEAGIEDVARADIVVIPTSGLLLDEKLIANSALLPWLRRQYDQGAHIAGVCMGAAYLAEAGLLEGRTATTHWAVAGQLAERYPNTIWRPELMVTEDSRVLCSGGVCASIDVSLYLVEKFCGHEIAMQCAKALLLNMPRLHQGGYAVLPLSPDHDDERIRDAEGFLQGNFRGDVSIEALAARAGMGARTFIRRFKAATGRLPGGYLQAVRVEHAKAMLESEGLPVQAVSSAVGYDDAAFFRDLFKRMTGMTPAQYRSRFASLAVRAPGAFAGQAAMRGLN